MENSQKPLKDGYKILSNNFRRDNSKQSSFPSFTDEQIKEVLEKSGENQPIRISLSQEQISSARFSKEINFHHQNKIRSGIPRPEVPSIYRNFSISSKEIEIDQKTNTKSEEVSDLLVGQNINQDKQPCRNKNLNSLNLSDLSASDKDLETTKPSTSNFKRLTTVTSSSVRAKPNQIQEIPHNKFICSLCKSTYKDPRVLDCLHSFCLPCLIHFEMMQSRRFSGKGEENSEGDLSRK